MPRKNVAIIVQTLCGGGAERIAANMSVTLQEQYNVYMIVFSSQNATYQHGGTLIDLDIPPNPGASRWQHIRMVLKRIKAVRRIKKECKIDYSISHLDTANLVNIFSKVKDKIYTVYHSMPSQAVCSKFKFIFLHNIIGRCSEQYITVSKLAAKDMTDSFYVPENKVRCIYNFIDVPHIQMEAAKPLEEEVAKAFFARHSPIVITIGRLASVKGQNHLLKILKAMKQIHPDCGAVILGEGEKREELESLVRQLNLEADVYMPGFVKNPFAYIKASDVFVLSSGSEGLPMVLLECLACGCPIVSTDMPSGAREILAPDSDICQVAQEKEYAQFGILVPVCKDGNPDPHALTKEEEILLDGVLDLLRDKELKQKYLEKASDCIHPFTSEQICKEWISMLEGSLQNNGEKS